MKPTKIEMYLDGQDEPIIVLADGRDFAAWEVAPDNDPERHQPTLMTRYVTWNAARRAGQLTVSWADFNRRLCVGTNAINEPDEAALKASESDPLA